MTTELPSPAKVSQVRQVNCEKEWKLGNGKSGLVEIPLIPLPLIDCRNLGNLETTSFVNVVLEEECNESQSYFRISDDKNSEVLKVVYGRHEGNKYRERGIKYLKCIDTTNNVVLLIGYPVGLGEVALLSPSEELVGECQSNVQFLCLSMKVKYNYYDCNGNRLMKMTGIISENKDEGKFMLIVKRPKHEKLALIKMGTLEKCCHMKFKRDVATIMDRLQIIALWIGFMHYQMEDTAKTELYEKREAMRKLRSQKLKSPSEIENNNSQTEENKSSDSSSQTSDNITGKLRRLKSLVNSTFVKHIERIQSTGTNNNVEDIKQEDKDSGRRDLNLNVPIPR